MEKYHILSVHYIELGQRKLLSLISLGFKVFLFDQDDPWYIINLVPVKVKDLTPHSKIHMSWTYLTHWF